MRATWPARLTLLYLIVVIVHGEEYNLWSSPSCNFLYPTVSPLTDPSNTQHPVPKHPQSTFFLQCERLLYYKISQPLKSLVVWTQFVPSTNPIPSNRPVYINRIKLVKAHKDVRSSCHSMYCVLACQSVATYLCQRVVLATPGEDILAARLDAVDSQCCTSQQPTQGQRPAGRIATKSGH
jgi:hypothetical protein